MDAEVLVDGLGAVVAGAHGDAGGVEDLSDVVRVDSLDGEGDHAQAVGGVGGAYQAQSGHLGEAVGWEGDGCSISQASISVMHDLVNGADLATVARLEADFDTLMHSRGKGVDDAVLDDLEDGAAFEGVSKYPNRVKCALLGWMALKDALAKSGVALPTVEPNGAE